jgi:hypothetical protein
MIALAVEFIQQKPNHSKRNRPEMIQIRTLAHECIGVLGKAFLVELDHTEVDCRKKAKRHLSPS